MTYAFAINPSLDRSRAYDVGLRAILSLDGGRAAFDTIRQWRGYAPTPLRDLPGLAADTGVARISYKQEAHRFGLCSFKALGGAYAVQRLVERRGGSHGLVLTSATDGNHGRAVAWGAKQAGVRAVIYIHETVSAGRANAIAAFGAEVRRVPGTYDDAVRASTEAAHEHGWTVLSDTSWPGYEDIPKDVMQGYAVLPMECEAQGATPTHVFVQGGVGGLAAAVLSYGWEMYGPARPIMTVVEPVTAACLYRSAEARALTTVGGALETIMAGLACGEPSLLAWRILQPGADAFMTIADDDAANTMRRLASWGIAAGESGVAGLAGFQRIAADPEARRRLGIDGASHILCYGTEGATDPDVYRSIVGREANAVEAVA